MWSKPRISPTSACTTARERMHSVGIAPGEGRFGAECFCAAAAAAAAAEEEEEEASEPPGEEGKDGDMGPLTGDCVGSWSASEAGSAVRSAGETLAMERTEINRFSRGDGDTALADAEAASSP